VPTTAISPNPPAAEAVLQCRRITKRFGGEVALADVDFSLAAGEVHGLVGGNGAGKSTLMRILAGALPDYEGQVLLDGEQVRLSSPQTAMSLGIAMVHQELSGIDSLSVAENLFLGRQPLTRLGWIDWKTMRRKARMYLMELGIDIDVRRRLDSFPLVVRQMVEIARGLNSGARVLILDEPTSALSPPETRRLFEMIAELRKRRVAVIFISHFIEDVLEICDRITILRDGQRVETKPVAQLDKHSVIHAMLGHAMDVAEVGYETSTTLPPRRDEPAVLRVQGLTLPGHFSKVSFEVAAGECVGLYGFVGAGHQELVHAIAGALRPSTGTITVDGVPLRLGNAAHAVRHHVALVAADRAQSLYHKAEIHKNVTLAHLRAAVGRWLSRKAELRTTEPVLRRVGCRPADPRLAVWNLSGGNQQKVVLAKWLLGPIRVLLLEEPTRGMDVQAKDEILKIIADLREQGVAVVLASIEPELLLKQADRILVVRRGKQTHEFTDTQLDKTTLLQYA